MEECVDVPGPEVCETVYDEECSKVPFEDCKVMNGMSYCVIVTVRLTVDPINVSPSTRLSRSSSVTPPLTTPGLLTSPGAAMWTGGSAVTSTWTSVSRPRGRSAGPGSRRGEGTRDDMF